jgi:pyruvate dehydrogenase E2 component (dihydrolipoamide acetyltransferase)
VIEPPAPGVKGEVEVIEPSRAQRGIARRAAEIRATVPDLELGVEVDIRQAIELAPGSGSIVPVLIRACALALRAFPRANGAYRDGHIELYSRINVGIVLEHGDEQASATLLDADQKTLAELDEELASFERRIGELTPPERSGATFTISYPGAAGVTRAVPLLPIPQAAAIAAGAPRTAVIVQDQTIVPGHVMDLTLACDHRILYGRHAASFLARVKELLERAEL